MATSGSGATAAGRGVQRGQGPGVQAAQGRPAGGAYGAEFEVRHDPLPSFGVVFLSLAQRTTVGRAARRRPAQRRAGRAFHRDIRTPLDPWMRNVFLDTSRWVVAR